MKYNRKVIAVIFAIVIANMLLLKKFTIYNYTIDMHLTHAPSNRLAKLY